MKPLLKWAGGKRGLIPRLSSLYAAYRDRVFVEVCAGGAALSFGLEPNEVWINDINPYLINFYCQVQRGMTITIPMLNTAETYYAHRARFNAIKDEHTEEAAQLFYYLNRTGFNGLCRFNQQGHFNVPFGKYKTISYIESVHAWTDLMRTWTITCTPFVPDIPSTAFIYADPPYDVEFTTYSPGGFRWDDQVRLAQQLAQHPGPVIASNQATSRIVTLYRDLGFTIEEITMPRRISCTGDRTPANEVLMTKNV